MNDQPLAEQPHEPGLVLLQRVVATQRIRSVYQPIVRLDDGACVGIEALARPVEMADDGSVSSLFQDALRDGTIRDLDWLCRRTAIRAAREVRPTLPLHLNVTLSGVDDPKGDAEKMLALARDCGRTARSIVLEFTDMEAVRPARLIGAIVAYRLAGFRIAIDGVSSSPAIELAAAVGPDFIKLHHRLPSQLHDLGALGLVSEALEAARPINARVLASGIEDELQAKLIRNLGVEAGQGYFFVKPAPIEALPPAMLEAPRPVSRRRAADDSGDDEILRPGRPIPR